MSTVEFMYVLVGRELEGLEEEGKREAFESWEKKRN